MPILFRVTLCHFHVPARTPPGPNPSIRKIGPVNRTGEAIPITTIGAAITQAATRGSFIAQAKYLAYPEESGLTRVLGNMKKENKHSLSRSKSGQMSCSKLDQMKPSQIEPLVLLYQED